MINRVIVMGGGSAGLIAAISLKKWVPNLHVTVIRSRAIGVIGVGEGTTYGVTRFLHEFLQVSHKRFFESVRPTWKMGLGFKWGARGKFYYPFEQVYDRRFSKLTKVDGFYADADMEASSRVTALMEHDRVFERGVGGVPVIPSSFGYHLENVRLVGYLEELAQSLGVVLRDEKVEQVKQDERGISGLGLVGGEVVEADLYVDCSGFVSALLGKALKEPFVSFKSSLQNDRAVVGGWERSDEVIQPYTACDTMNAGWCWRIDHEDCINCGYVHSSDFISEADAEAEFRRYHPKAKDVHLIKFVSGRYERAWVKNVVAIGNASGFVEPLEATALGVICVHSALLTETLRDCDRQVRKSQIDLYNRQHMRSWEQIRDFLSVHYRFNTHTDSPYWEFCRNETNLAGAAPIVEYYRENGPSELFRASNVLMETDNQFGLNGYYALLLGQRVPFEKTYVPPESELLRWKKVRDENRAIGERGFSVKEMMEFMRSPWWKWSS